MEEILNWIDRKIDDVSDNYLFEKYFTNDKINRIEKNFYLTNKFQGIGIVMSQNLIITSVNFYSGKLEDSQIFKEELPLNLEFSFNREGIHQRFGKPNRTGGGNTNIYLGNVPYWDKYYFDKYTLHIQYSRDCSMIDMITVGSLQLEEYFNSELQ